MTDPHHRGNTRPRIFDLLLGFAGRIDDDALTECRELLAVVEADRAMALLLGCLCAADAPVTQPERDELSDLARAVLGDSTLADRLPTGPDATAMWHRFTAAGTADPCAGVLEAVGPTLDVLPDVQGLRCAWRCTPAGQSPGPVPHRVVLVEVATGGHPAAVAYRLELALRRAGIRAGVEVLTGAVIPEYQQAALDVARELPIGRAPARLPATPPQEPERPFENWAIDDRPAAEPVPPQPAPTERPADGPRRPTMAPVPVPASSPPPGREPSRAQRPQEMPAPPVRAPEPVPAPAPPQPVEPPAEPRHGGAGFFPAEVAAEVDAGTAAAGTADADQELNEQERDLLRRLHEELGRREREPAVADPEPDTDRTLTEAQTAIWPAPGFGDISSRL